jgi:CotS family spore coat protein
MISEKRIPMLHKLYVHMMENGCDRVDAVIENKEHELFSTSEDGIKYVVKRWYDGKECDIRKEQEIVGATKNLAKLHKVLRGPIDFGEESETFVMEGEDLRKEYCRHNREMKKVRAFIRGKVGKGEFELMFLKYFDAMYDWAQSASARLEQSEYELLMQQSREKTTITHGEYNYHNVLMMQDGIATTNFEHFHQDVQLADLYYFLRKTMEKNHWNVMLGDKMLEAYSEILPLGEREMEYLAISLSYPEKFWKAANSYYRSSKAWIPMKSVEKLEVAIHQTEEKKHFLEAIFSFHL